MKKHTRRNFCTTLLLFAAFLLWTIAISCFDVQAIGPDGSSVGFAALNAFIHNLTGVHMALYTVTDWLGLVPLCFAAGFALLGLVQLIQRKHICRVDDNILILGGFYILVIAAYSFFEMFVVNYRPVLIDGCLEVSYPSSTTLLVLCILPTTMMQLHTRIHSPTFRKVILCTLAAFTALMVVGRFLSGVHWFTDIVGGILLSAGLVMLYSSLCSLSAFRRSSAGQARHS